MKARIEKSKVRRMGVAHGSAILYKNGDRLPGGMIFRAYDDSETMQERGNTHANLFVQCPYCGEVVSVRSNSAKRNQSCGCMMGNHVGKNKPQEFPKGWIYDSDAGRDAHNHPLVNVHSKWDETDKADRYHAYSQNSCCCTGDAWRQEDSTPDNPFHGCKYSYQKSFYVP